MRWLIDGYNVIRRDPHLRSREAESLEAGRRALLHLLARAHRDRRDEVIVVFDGARVSGGTPSEGRIRVLFSRPPSTADDELMRLARQWREGAAVVSSDRRIQDAARRAGCPVLEVTQFLEGLEAGASLESRDSGNDAAPTKRGNPRRLSKKARRDQRALRRLRHP
jgi:predicted RNA-binding protein with PIN domain